MRGMPRYLRPGLAAVISAAGLWLVGQGVWIHAKAGLAQVLLDRAFEQTVATGRPHKPWSWADTWPVARVEVPRLRRRAIVLSGASGQALAFGPAQLNGTPRAGAQGVTVIAGHRDTHLAFLKDVREGDEIDVVRDDGRRVKFRVSHMTIARWDRSRIDPHASGSQLVLATCWPLDGHFRGPMRYLVWADKVT